MERKYFYSIDFLKFFCAIAVILIHITTHIKANGVDTFYNYYIYRYFLEIAVPFFFASSGFFLGQKLLIKNDSTIILIYIKKIISIYITFSFFYLAFKFIITISDALFYNQPLKVEIYRLIKTISYRSLINGSVGSFHLWFLASLIYACLILYLLLKVKSNANFILITAIFFFTLLSTRIFELPKLFNHGSIILGVLYVSIGFFLGQFKDIKKFKYPFFYTILYAFFFFISSKIGLGISSIFLALWTFYLIVLCVSYPNIGRDSYFTKLSRFALAIYILHIFVRDIVLKIYEYFGFSEFYLWLPNYLILMTLCTIIPIYLYNPIYNLLEKIKSKLIFN
jgi:hypothetical protein